MQLRATRSDWAQVMNELSFAGSHKSMADRLDINLEDASPGWWTHDMPLDDKITLVDIEPDLYWFAAHFLWVIRNTCELWTIDQAVEYAGDNDPDGCNDL